MSLFKNIKFLDTIRPKLLSILNHSVIGSPLTSHNQVKTMRSILDGIEPVVAFIKHPDKNKLVGVLPYTVAAVTILSLSAIVFGVVWTKKESLNKFIQNQYDKLTAWTQQKYVGIHKKKLEREQERQLKKQDRAAQELEKQEQQRLEEQARSQTWAGYFSSKLVNTSQGTIKKLLDPTDKSSWGLLSAMWVQYLSGLRVPGVQSQLPLDAVVVATVAKFVVFVGYLIKTFVRAEIYGDQYDPLFIRLPESILVSFLDLLHSRLKHIKLSDESKSDDETVQSVKDQIATLESARKSLRENIVDLQRSTTPTKLAKKVTSVQRMQTQLELQKRQLLNRIEMLTEPKKYTLNPILSTEFSGGTHQSTLWSKKFSPNDPFYLKVWISLAEDILSFNQTQDTVTLEMQQLALVIDGIKDPNKRKVKGWPGFPTKWNTFLDKTASMTAQTNIWTVQRDMLLNLRKFITVYILNPSLDIVNGVQNLDTIDLEKFGVPVVVLKTLETPKKFARRNGESARRDEEFRTPTSRVSQIGLSLNEFIDKDDRKTLNDEVKSMEIVLNMDKTVEAKNKTLKDVLNVVSETVERIETKARSKLQTYMKSVADLYLRHQETIKASRVACQLLKYFVALRDAYDTSVALYIQNRTLEVKESDLSKHLLHIDDIYNQLVNTSEETNTAEEKKDSYFEISESQKYVSYEDAMNMVYNPLKRLYEEKYTSLLTALKGEMCKIYHVSKVIYSETTDSDQTDVAQKDLSATRSNDLVSIKQLYNIGDKCTDHKECEDCECDPTKPEQKIKKPVFKPFGERTANKL